MEILNMPRGTGKTTSIIIEAYKTGLPIITMNNTTKRDLEWRAEVGFQKKVTVYTINNFMNTDFWKGKKRPNKVLIDELSYVLSSVLNADCELATMTSGSLENYYMERDYESY